MKKFRTAIVVTAFFASAALAAQQTPEPQGGLPPPPPHEFEPRQQGKVPPPPQPGMKHPLIFALESEDFTAKERTELKALSRTDPRKFSEVMRRHFIERRRAEAKRTLELRQACLNAKTPDEKAKAVAALREDVKRSSERRMAFQKKIISETEKSIEMMQKRLTAMKAQLEKRAAEKDGFVNRRVEELLAGKIPERILRDANASLETEKPAPEKKK